MNVILHIKFNYNQYPFLLRGQTPLSMQQKISREQAAKQKSFETKLINSFMRKGKKLKMNNIMYKWWVYKYRYMFRYLIYKYEVATPEEIVKKFASKIQFVQFIQKDYIAWSMSDLLVFRLISLISIFQLKQYKRKNTPVWYVTYLTPNKRLNYIYTSLIMHLRAVRLSSKKIEKTFDYTFYDFFEKNDIDQELYDIKIQAYNQFLF